MAIYHMKRTCLLSTADSTGIIYYVITICFLQVKNKYLILGRKKKRKKEKKTLPIVALKHLNISGNYGQNEIKSTK